MANKRKTTTAIVAGVTAAALLLGGTFAWTSISQQAKNEAIVDINPGGRLHDDFNGTNKDVYVENFGDDITGVNIFARIRLDQYFEVGQEAGKNKDNTVRNVDVKLGGAINDVTTWKTYTPTINEDGNIDFTNPIQANDNWQWTLGNDEDNKPIYLPTFNMNKDSLAADINGTYEGTVEDDIVHYDDYKTYTENQEVEGTEVYDWDEDTEEESEALNNFDNGGITTDASTPIDSADVYHKSTVTDETDGSETNLTHTAKAISTTATVMSMADWLQLPDEEKMGDFWVYDTDGWAYWANPIEPGETTGLLLDGIQLSRVPDDNYYYGINVVGQFATDSDWQMFFASVDEGGAGEGQMTENAKTLMGIITGTPADDTTGGETEDPSVETPTYYTMDVAYPLESGTTVNLGVQDYTPVNAEEVSYYIIDKANNPNGGSATELEAQDGMKVVPITFEAAGGAYNQTLYYYAELFENGSAVTTTDAIEGVTFAALDGDTVVAFNCTKVYDNTVHNYLGMGTYAYEDEDSGNTQYTGCMVFESVANPDTYCSVGDANMGVDGDDNFVVTTGVTKAADDADYDYNVTTITEEACPCTASTNE